MNYLVIGCGPGSMGEAIAYRLLSEKNTRVFITDQNPQNIAMTMIKLRQLCRRYQSECDDLKPFYGPGLDIMRDKVLLPHLFEKFDVVMSAVPASLNPIIAEAVVRSNRYRAGNTPKTHYCDLGGVLDVTKKLIHWDMDQLAKHWDISIVPDCGLQPGLGGIIAVDLLKKFDPSVPVESIIIYVGGLPYNYSAPPFYKKLFNLKGLAEIYYNAPLVLHKGRPLKISKLSHYETISTREFDLFFGSPDIIKFEAAVTGGLGALPYYLRDQVTTLREKTLRFVGHFGAVKKMPPEKFESIFSKWLDNFPVQEKDFIVMKVEAVGKSAIRNERIKVEKLLYVESDENWNAMQKTTGFTTAVIAKLIAEGKALPGAMPPEIALDPSVVLDALRKDFKIYERATPLK